MNFAVVLPTESLVVVGAEDGAAAGVVAGVVAGLVAGPDEFPAPAFILFQMDVISADLAYTSPGWAKARPRTHKTNTQEIKFSFRNNLDLPDEDAPVCALGCDFMFPRSLP